MKEPKKKRQKKEEKPKAYVLFCVCLGGGFGWGSVKTVARPQAVTAYQRRALWAKLENATPDKADEIAGELQELIDNATGQSKTRMENRLAAILDKLAAAGCLDAAPMHQSITLYHVQGQSPSP